MKLRPALFLLAAAADLVPAGAGNGASIPTPTPPPSKEDDDDDNSTKKLKAEWKGKSYAAIAAHHVRLCQQGHHDEADAFHTAVVKTFKDKK